VRLAVARQTLDELAERDRGYAHGELLALVKAEYESHLESSKTDGARRKEGLVQEATAAADRKIFTLKEDLDRLARDHERLLQELKELKSQVHMRIRCPFLKEISAVHPSSRRTASSSGSTNRSWRIARR